MLRIPEKKMTRDIPKDMNVMIKTFGIKLFEEMGQKYKYLDTMTSDISGKSRENQ